LLTLGLVLTVVVVAFEPSAVAAVLPAVVEEVGGLRLHGWAFSELLLTQLEGRGVAVLVVDQRGPRLLVGGVAASTSVLLAGRARQGPGGRAINAIAAQGLPGVGLRAAE
jgi:hypothetical protein